MQIYKKNKKRCYFLYSYFVPITVSLTLRSDKHSAKAKFPSIIIAFYDLNAKALKKLFVGTCKSQKLSLPTHIAQIEISKNNQK